MSQSTEPDNPPRFHAMCGQEDCGHEHTGEAGKPHKGLFSTLVPPSAEANATPPPSHAPSYSGGVHEPHLPKSQFNRGWWVAGMVATVGIGAYLINEYGKMSEKKKEGVSGSADWKQRITAKKTERQRS